MLAKWAGREEQLIAGLKTKFVQCHASLLMLQVGAVALDVDNLLLFQVRETRCPCAVTVTSTSASASASACSSANC